VVASDIDGVRQIVTSDRLGVLTPPGDAAALAAAIGRLLQNPELAAALGRAAHDAARTEHCMDRLEQRLTAVIDPLFAAAAAAA
jgi:glycosyltransferase involved in cell wall biosynthesis